MDSRSSRKNKVIFLITLLAFGFAGFAQSPQLINYQGVARNAVGNPLANQKLNLRLSVRNLSSTGAVVYSETRLVTTNGGGLYTVLIGGVGATATSGTIEATNWQIGSKFLQVEVDPNAGNNFIDLGTTQLVSVPYALSAGTAGNSATVTTNANLRGAVTSIGNATSIAASPALTGVPTAPTAEPGTNTNQIATTEFVKAAALTGPTGAKGVQGLAGADGAAGAQGIQGLAGVNGAAGTQGIQGLAGTNGAAGAQGIQGLRGSAGAAGVAGSAGSQGIQGLTGAVGTTGAAGAQGIQGLTGSVADVAAISGTSTANGASITSGVLSLAPADATNGGIITTGAQIFAGAKTFSSTVTTNVLGVGTNSPSASAQLDVSSTSKGFLPPRMTEEQRDLIAVNSVSAGLIIWCTNCGVSGELEVYNGVTWTNMVGASAALSTVLMGSQYWRGKNLDVATYRDGTVIPQVTNNADWTGLTTGAWCYYNNDPANGAIYGKLYNWYAVAGIWNEASKTDASQRKKLAPTGFHVPTDEEWLTLSTNLGGNTVAGGKMKTTGTTRWTAPNTDATNESGFAALPGGLRASDGKSYQLGAMGFWFSATDFDSGRGGVCYLENYDGWLGLYPDKKFYGFSVRCLRD